MRYLSLTASHIPNIHRDRAIAIKNDLRAEKKGTKNVNIS
jgi:hypothetical protein